MPRLLLATRTMQPACVPSDTASIPWQEWEKWVKTGLFYGEHALQPGAVVAASSLPPAELWIEGAKPARLPTPPSSLPPKVSPPTRPSCGETAWRATLPACGSWPERCAGSAMHHQSLKACLVLLGRRLRFQEHATGRRRGCCRAAKCTA